MVKFTLSDWDFSGEFMILSLYYFSVEVSLLVSNILLSLNFNFLFNNNFSVDWFLNLNLYLNFNNLLNWNLNH